MATEHELKNAVKLMRLWAREGFPKRADGSLPPDVITAMRWICDVKPEQLNYRRFEKALVAGPDFDYVLPRHHQWSTDDIKRAKQAMA